MFYNLLLNQLNLINKNKMNLKDLVKNDKPYYGSGTYEVSYETFKDFYDEMNEYDIDMNLCYRFDLKHVEDEDKPYTLQIFTILQRKGAITAHYIKDFEEADIPLLKKYLEPHQKVCKQLINF